LPLNSWSGVPMLDPPQLQIPFLSSWCLTQQ
jgi:hypothetical protein